MIGSEIATSIENLLLQLCDLEHCDSQLDCHMDSEYNKQFCQLDVIINRPA